MPSSPPREDHGGKPEDRLRGSNGTTAELDMQATQPELVTAGLPVREVVPVIEESPAPSYGGPLNVQLTCKGRVWAFLNVVISGSSEAQQEMLRGPSMTGRMTRRQPEKQCHNNS